MAASPSHPQTADGWIDHLDLEAHPEGGYYRETYRTRTTLAADALPNRFGGERDAAAHIYFLLPADAFSALHRIRQAEIWHFYAGAPLDLHELTTKGSHRVRTLGRAVEDGHRLHAAVPAGSWFGATVAREEGYALVGCTTAPAFEFDDFELGDPAALRTEYPDHGDVIDRLTR